MTVMKTELSYYDIFPKVIRKNKKVTICIKPLGAHVEFTADKYIIYILPITEGSKRDYPKRPNNVHFEVAPCADGCLRLNYTFPSEQEYFIRVCDVEDKRLFQLSVYCVDDDLAGRYPFAGDLHMHTCRSDGKESPPVVAANYRKHGYDFLAITDHERYYPSLEAIDAYKDVPIEYCLIPGEEVHTPDIDSDRNNDVHIVNFGGEFSICGLIKESDHCVEAGEDKKFRCINPDICPETMTTQEFWAEVDKTLETLDIPDGIEKHAYACCKWIFDKIREANGLGIFAHPYWISNVFQVPETFVEYMMEQQPFDAFEVLGGENYFEQNGLQTIRYYEDKAKGRRYPIVGSTDSHGSINNRNGFICSTIVFSPENERVALINSIKDMYSVAVDSISTEFRIVGDMRLVRYACFLLNSYFPLHDELCFEEGRAMKDYACGDEDAAAYLKAISGRMKKQREKYFSF